MKMKRNISLALKVYACTVYFLFVEVLDEEYIYIIKITEITEAIRMLDRFVSEQCKYSIIGVV